jgi:hypothetical protein
MKRETDARVRERELGLQRVRRFYRAVLAAAAGGCLAFAGLAAVTKSAHATGATGTSTGTAATTRAKSTPRATTSQTTTATPTIAAPTFTPTPTPAAPVTSSGGS